MDRFLVYNGKKNRDEKDAENGPRSVREIVEKWMAREQKTKYDVYIDPLLDKGEMKIGDKR